MLEIVVGNTGEVILDNFSEMLERFPQDAARAMRSALQSEGAHMRLELQRTIARGGPAAKTWEKLNPHTGVLRTANNSRARLKNWKWVWAGKKGAKTRRKQYWESKKSTATAPFTKFSGGIRYRMHDDSVSVGFVSGGWWDRYIPGHAAGYSIPVTDRMRKKFFALGFPLKKTTTTLRAPKRPLIQPVFEAQEPQIIHRLSRKFFSNVARYQDERSGVKWLKNEWGDYVAPQGG